jgi:hypothetical protein
MTSVLSRFSEASATAFDMPGPAVHTDLLARLGIDLEAELGGDHRLVALHSDYDSLGWFG